MACASSDQSNEDVKILTFKAPAGEIFGSFQEQANYFLDTYWPNWKNYENPKSYMIPPTFKYKHSEVSDQNFDAFRGQQKEKVAKNSHEIITDRQADEAEFEFYNGIQYWIENEVAAPFVAIRNFNLKLNFDSKKNKLNGFLTEIFPNINWNKFREILKKPSIEFDFLLIGPKIGIIVVEVKSSSFEQHFNKERNLLPNEYKYGLKQLECINGLIYLLQECTGAPLPNNDCVTKILFTPNLEKERYENWISNLTALEQQRVHERVGTVVQVFKQKGMEFALEDISTELYEEYARVLAAMSSTMSMNGIEFSTLNLSEYKMALRENEYLVQHNLQMDKKNKQIVPSSGLVKASKEVKKYSNVFFLTPDQQKALHGPRYQFIAGAAGTGKTIILQAKACELLAKGESVAIYSMGGYAYRYKLLFDNYGFINYKIYELGLTTEKTDIKFRNYLELGSLGFTHQDFINIMDLFIESKIQNPRSNLAVEFECLTSFDNILIDDAADQTGYFQNYISYLIMRYVQNVIKKNSCWVTIDPCYDNFIYNLLINKDDRYNDYREDISITTLKQVMRCSEEIFTSVYIPAMTELELEAVSGHKIQGSKVKKITEHFTAHAAALTALWVKLETELESLISHGIDLRNIAIIVSNDDWKHEDVDCKDFLRDRCKQRWPNAVSEYDYFTGIFEELTSNTNLIPKNELLFLITSSHNVSSLEWPIVICINLLSTVKIKDAKYACYLNYRAMSRATAKLIDITFTCEEPSTEDVEWSLSEQDLLIDLFKKCSNVIKNINGFAFNSMNTEEKQAWDNICDEFNASVESGPRRTRTEIIVKIKCIFDECNNYAITSNFDASTKTEKPRYFDIFNEIDRMIKYYRRLEVDEEEIH